MSRVKRLDTAAGRPADVVRAGTAIAVTVPSVLDHEVVAIDLATM